MKRLISILAALCVLLTPFGAWAGTTYGLLFTSGGTSEVEVGDTLTGSSSAATAVVSSITLSSGSWAGTDAAGQFVLTSQSGTFQSETLNEGANTNVCNIVGDSSSVIEAWTSPSKGVSLITFTIIGESNGGNVHPAETGSDIDSFIFLAKSNPGTTAPTALWDYTFVAEDGEDVLGGEGADRSATTTERIRAKTDTSFGEAYVDGTGTLTITNNSVNSAAIVIKVYIRR